MASKWRQNIVDTNMQLSQWQLCARITTSPNPIYLVKETNTKWGVFSLVGLVPGSVPVRTSGPNPIPPGGRFPYGLPVEPD